MSNDIHDIHDIPDKKRLKLLAKLAEGDVLDVGCHDVQNPYLTNNNIVGFDLVMPEVIQPHYSKFVEGNCQEIDTFFEPQSFDTIIAGEIIEHLENAASFLRGCHKVLKDSGKLMMTTPNPYHWTTIIGNSLFMTSGITYDHINLFPFRAMVALLSHTGWKVSEVKNASRGMRLVSSSRKFFLPCPKALAYQHMYICKKK